ncbi:MAG: O-antigen ligase family protein [Patescibacteria group bacterium]
MNLFIIIAILALFGLFIIQPKYGLYLTAACLPIIGRDFYFFNFVIPIADSVALLSLLAFFIRLIIDALFNKERVRLYWPLLLPFSIFFIVSLVSIFFSNHQIASLYYFLRWPFFLYFAYIFVPANIIKTPRILKTTTIIVFLSAMLVLISGYASLYGQDWQDSFFRLKSIMIFGSYPFGENHNLIAEFLNIGAFFVLIIREFLRTEKEKRISDIIFFLTAVGIILTFSRAGWITLFLQSLIYFFYRTNGNKKERMAMIIFSILVMIIISPLLWKMSSLQAKNTSSTENRILLTEIAFEAFKEKPLIGYGNGEFVNLVSENIRFRAKYGEPLDSHGMLQKLLVENGIIGLSAWLFLLLYLARTAFLALKRYYPKLKWMLPFCLAAGGGLFFQFFNTSYFKGRVWLPIVLFLIAIKFSDEIYAKKNNNPAHSTKS